jgi:hypothetical protein
MKWIRWTAPVAAACVACTDGTGAAREHGFVTREPAQAMGRNGASVTALLTVGDSLPDGFTWAPTPDGLGAYAEGGRVIVLANHELGGIAANDGSLAYPTARVSRLVIDPATESVLSGSWLLDGSEGYRRLCSATLADAASGMPGRWFLTGEETTGDAKDGIQLAVSTSGQVVEMPWIGRFRHENLVPVRGFAGRVVLAGTDDTHGASELYLYVAASGADVLAGRGTLYVLTSPDAANAGQLHAGGSVAARFVAIPNAAALSSAQLQAAADAAGGLRFAALEDAASDPRVGSAPALYFADTGDRSVPSAAAPWDPYGSLYRLAFDPADPTGGRLMLLARSAGPVAGFASPDNLATGAASLMVQEDPGAAFGRPPRIWRFPLAADGSLGAPTAVAELADPGCATGACWESSGIVDASAWFGPGAWLFDVQAHTTPVPALNLPRENGQLLLLRAPGS